MPETTALGAAMAAGHAIGVWNLENEDTKVTTDVFTSSVSEAERDERFDRWKEAVKRCMHWVPSGQKEGRLF